MELYELYLRRHDQINTWTSSTEPLRRWSAAGPFVHATGSSFGATPGSMRRGTDSSKRRRAQDLDRTGGLSGRTDPVEVDGRGVVFAGVPVERLACSRVLEGQHPGGR